MDNFIKTVKSTIIWTTLIFVALTLLTMKNESASDGFDTYGFPLTFFNHFEGKCDDCYSKFGLKIYNLLADILFALTFGFLITVVRRKFSIKQNASESGILSIFPFIILNCCHYPLYLIYLGKVS